MKSAKGKVNPELEEKITKYFDDALKKNWVEEESDFASDQTYQRLLGSIAKKERLVLSISWVYQAVAAVLLISLMTSLFFYYRSNDQSSKHLVMDQKAAAGTLNKIELPDGTEIWLNADSKVGFPSEFANDKREITLEGEAFFKVKHEEKRPFLIRTQDMVTQVLGTSFNVSAYPQEQQIKVTVLSGKVAVYKQTNSPHETPEQPLFLTTNQQGIYSKKQKSLVLNKKEIKSTDAVAWKEGNLIFKDTELREVIGRLERRYAIRIDMDTDLTCPVTVNFDNEPLERVMRVLAQLVNGKVNYNSGRYRLSGVLCQ